MYDAIVVIYNPNSTGDAPEDANYFRDTVDEREDLTVKVSLSPTAKAGDAIRFARETALSYVRPLIVSASGDGGYNEVINGVMRARSERPEARPVVAVIASGNANDHKRETRDENLVELIVHGKPSPLDLLRITSSELDRYAHSYIGIGLTSYLGRQINRHGRGRGRLVEALIILKGLWDFTPVTISHDGTEKLIDSLVVANISSMSKVVKLDKGSETHDGLFEVIEMQHTEKIHLLVTLLVMVVRGLTRQPASGNFSFTPLEDMLVQFDGEVGSLRKDEIVTITNHKHAVESLY